MTHKLGKELTFGLIYNSDLSVFSMSKLLVFWPTNPNRCFLHDSTLISAAPEWSHYSTWEQHAWQIFHILAGPLGSIPDLTSILKLFIPKNPLASESWVMFKKHAVLSLPSYISKSPPRSKHRTVLQSQSPGDQIFISASVYTGVASPLEMPRSSIYEHPCRTRHWSGFSSYLTWISISYSEAVCWIFIFNLIDHILWRGKLCYWKRTAGE